ncbi:15551_t:CDS:2, partial [Racocetra persica]
TTRIISKESEQDSRPENKFKNIISEVNDIDILIEDLLVENNLKVQELINEGIIEMINYEFDEDKEEAKNNNDENPLLLSITITETIEALKKVIRYQE